MTARPCHLCGHVLVDPRYARRVRDDDGETQPVCRQCYRDAVRGEAAEAREAAAISRDDIATRLEDARDGDPR